jgi:cell division initiation protein
MNLTPSDVEQKAFTQALRGYQMDEVDDFLDEVVNTLRNYDQRLRDAQDKIKVLESEASNRGGDESAISRAILTAQRSADALVAEAKADADRIRSKATAEADELQAAREAERTKILGEIGGMRGLMDKLRERLSELSGTVGRTVVEMDGEIERTQSELEVANQKPAHAAPAIEAPVVEAPAIEEPASIFPGDGQSRDDRLFGLRDRQNQPASPVPAGNELGSAEPEAEPDVGGVVSRAGARPWERG